MNTLLSVIAALALLLATFTVHGLVLKSQNDQVTSVVETFAAGFAAKLEAHVNVRLSAIDYFRRELERNGVVTEDDFQDVAQSVHELFDDLQALSWVNSDAVIRIVTPRLGNEAALGLDLKKLEVPFRTLIDAQQTGLPRVTPPITLAQGGTGFAAYIPVLSDGALSGYLNIVFRSSPLIYSTFSSTDSDRFQIRITDGDAQLFGVADPKDDPRFTVRSIIDVGGRAWEISVTPTDRQIAAATSMLDEIVLVFGVLIALSISVLIHLANSRLSSLAKSETQARAVLNTVVDGIITIDGRGTIMEFNPASERLFGYAADEVRGQNITLLMPTPDARKHDTYLARFNPVNTNQNVIGKGRELIGVRKDGSTFTLELSVSITKDHGQRIFTGVLRDVTERKKIEAMKDTFVSNVSHELRTPLTTIRGALGLLSVKSRDALDEQSQRLLDLSNDGSERLSKLVNDILDIEKIAAGKLDYSFEEVEISSLVADIVDRHSSYAEMHNVEFTLVAAPDPVYCMLDKSRFDQALVNLLSNAAKFSPPRATVVFSVTQAKKDRVCISVADKGPGIPEEFIPRVFEKFMQADSSSTRAKGGSGLGLSITKEIILAFGGTVDFTTSETGGTTFRIYLPSRAEPFTEFGMETAIAS